MTSEIRNVIVSLVVGIVGSLTAMSLWQLWTDLSRIEARVDALSDEIGEIGRIYPNGVYPDRGEVGDAK